MTVDRRTLLAGLATLPAIAQIAHAEGSESWPAAVTRHGAVVIGGRRIAYVATTAEAPIPGPEGRIGASIFYSSYVAQGASRSRPVAFFFNGGPGAPSIGLRQSFAPVMHTAAPANHPTPNGAVFVGNPNSALDAADLVFIDPPGTGFSRILPGSRGADFWGNLEDARATTAFILGWLERNGRFASPVYIVGESYGGLRAPLVSDLLSRSATPVHLAGALLISPATGFDSVADPKGAEHRFVASIPTFAAVAWSHGRGAGAKASLEAAVAPARAFAVGEYRSALDAGDALSASDFDRVVARYAELTGLTPDFVRTKKLRVSNNDFVHNLLADKEERTGLFDGRAHVANALAAKRKPPFDDPSDMAYDGSYDGTLAWRDYFTGEIGYRPLIPFERINFPANKEWARSRPDGGYANAPQEMRALMEREPKFRLMQVGGYFDLTLPFELALEAYAGAGLPQERLIQRTYRSGHAIFSDPVEQPKAAAEFRRFLRGQHGLRTDVGGE